MEARYVADSRVTMSRLMGAMDANGFGNVHGGVIMRMVDEGGALAAMRHAQNPVVTVAIDSMTFKKPIRIGALLIVKAELTYVGRTSMETRVQVIAEHPLTGEATHTNSAFVVYVAIHPDGTPCEVPPLLLETEEEKMRWKNAEQRQLYRKAQHAEEEAIDAIQDSAHGQS